MENVKFLNIHVYGGDIRVGDLMRFRMSKHDPVKMLEVLSIRETRSRKRVHVALQDGHHDTVSKIETRLVRRAVTLRTEVTK